MRALNSRVPRASQGDLIDADSVAAAIPTKSAFPELDAIPAGTRFGAIMADPPIAFATRSPKGEGRCPQQHYPCMPLAELTALPIAEIAAADCFLFLWVPLRSVDQVVPLMTAWGFRFSGSAFVWAKQNKSGTGFFMGNGFTTRKNVEVCWLGRRGSPKRRSMGVRELIVAPRREHSRKPDEVYERIEALCEGPYLDLFSRQQRPGWVCVGDESGRFA
jgi:N6-adenosine-specific RNA methylase IME4